MKLCRNLLVSLAVLTALTAPTLAQTPPPVRLPLSQAKPSEIVQLLLGMDLPTVLPNGLTMLSADDENRHLLAQGSPESLKRLKEIVRLLDVSQKSLLLDARVLLQTPDGGTNKPNQEVIATAKLQMTNNREGEMLLLGQGRVFRVRVTPHINGDGTLTLNTRFSILWQTSREDGSYQRNHNEMTTNRRMRNGEAKMTAAFGVGNESSEAVASSIRMHGIDRVGEVNAPMFLLELKPTTVDAKADTKKRISVTGQKSQKVARK